MAEICRYFGSKTPLRASVDKLKSSQQSQLNNLVDNQHHPTQPQRNLRCKAGEPTNLSPEEIMAALKKKQQEDEAKRLEKRAAVNLFQVLPHTCYKEKLKLEKWSEKVAALDALIEAGGEQPYKLCSPSSSVDYLPLIRDLKPLLGHTHFAVCSKALAAFGMLAEGVGESMATYMRPMLPIFFGLFKDKKVTKAAGLCLDKMFGNVLSFDNLLDKTDALPSSLDEKKERNSLVRKSCLEFLTRCVSRSGMYGKKGDLTPLHAKDISVLGCDKLNDPDASTRKSATELLVALLGCKNEDVVLATKTITASLEASNSRAFKALLMASKPCAPASIESSPIISGTGQNHKGVNERENPTRNSKTKVKAVTLLRSSEPTKNATPVGLDSEAQLPSLEDSIEYISAIGIPQWSDDVDDGGILAGLKSSNWKQRMGAINKLTFYYDSGDEHAFSTIPSIFVCVRDCTKGFKESNFNVARSLLEFFSAILGAHTTIKKSPETFVSNAATRLAVEKLNDKKLYESASTCLFSICQVKEPHITISHCVKAINGLKSPLAHEALLNWLKLFCVNFGAAALSNYMQDMLTWVLKECDEKNIKVKNAAIDVIGELHSQLGPPFEAFVKSKDMQTSIMAIVEKAMKDRPFDPNAKDVNRKIKCVTLLTSGNTVSSAKENSAGSDGSTSFLSLPKMDLIDSLGNDILNQIVLTEGKNSWKQRKEAMDNVIARLSKCSGMLSTDHKAFNSLKELIAAIRSRLNDSQSNLKPLAARAIGSILSHTDEQSQAKIGKAVFPSLVNAAMNDTKKTMRDAAISSLTSGIKRNKLDGGGTNLLSLDVFIASMESELSDAALKSAGLADVLFFLAETLQSICSNNNVALKGIKVSSHLAKIIVTSLLSSKSGTRLEAEKILKISLDNDLVAANELEKEIAKLLPAQQRTLRSFVPNSSSSTNEVAASRKTPLQSTSRSTPSRQLSRTPSAKSTPRSLTGSTSCHKPALFRSDSIGSIDKSPTDTSDHNPLQTSISKSSDKMKRLAAFGKRENWPEYPAQVCERPPLSAIKKSWSQIIPSSSLRALFPESGILSQEDCIKGCEVISRAIAHSRKNDDDSITHQLDLILKWTVYGICARDHTSGSRSLLSVLADLFQRLKELTYIMNDIEAIIILPYILENTGVAKSQFKETFTNLLALIKSNGLYPADRYGPFICMLVLEKSPFPKARLIAAIECSNCIKSCGLKGIGKKGIGIVGKALSEESLIENRSAYLELVELIVDKLNGDTARFASLCGDSNLNKKTRTLIEQRCGKRQADAQRQDSLPHGKTSKASNVKGPSNRDADEPSKDCHNTSHELKLRLQRRLREEGSDTGSRSSLPPPPKQLHQKLMPQKDFSECTSYVELTNTLVSVFKEAESASMDDPWVAKGYEGIQKIFLLVKRDSSALDPSEFKDLSKAVQSNFDSIIELLTSALSFAFNRDGKDACLSNPFIELTVVTITGLLHKMPALSKTISHQTLSNLMRETISALLDGRLDAASAHQKSNKNKENTNLVRLINKLALRSADAPSVETTILVLISLQRDSLLALRNTEFNPKFSRVLTKLFKKATKITGDENNIHAMNSEFNLDIMMESLNSLLLEIDELSSTQSVDDELLIPSKEMAEDMMEKLLTHRGCDAIRGSVQRIDTPDATSSMKSLICRSEKKMGITPTFDTPGSDAVENKSVIIADLIKDISESVEDRQKELALEELRKFDISEVEANFLQSYVSNHFKEYVLGELRSDGSSKKFSQLQYENHVDALSHSRDVPLNSSTANTSVLISERIKSINNHLKRSGESRQYQQVLQETCSRSMPSTQMSSQDASGLRARLEALKKNKDLK